MGKNGMKIDYKIQTRNEWKPAIKCAHLQAHTDTKVETERDENEY